MRSLSLPSNVRKKHTTVQGRVVYDRPTHQLQYVDVVRMAMRASYPMDLPALVKVLAFFYKEMARIVVLIMRRIADPIEKGRFFNAFTDDFIAEALNGYEAAAPTEKINWRDPAIGDEVRRLLERQRLRQKEQWLSEHVI